MFQTTNQIIIIFPLLLVFCLLTTINHHYITITLSHYHTLFGDFPAGPKMPQIALEKCCKIQARVASFMAEAIAPGAGGAGERSWGLGTLEGTDVFSNKRMLDDVRG
jgi:hypothetical protein